VPPVPCRHTLFNIGHARTECLDVGPEPGRSQLLMLERGRYAADCLGSAISLRGCRHGERVTVCIFVWALALPEAQAGALDGKKTVRVEAEFWRAQVAQGRCPGSERSLPRRPMGTLCHRQGMLVPLRMLHHRTECL
jgi:hypothetical protein